MYRTGSTYNASTQATFPKPAGEDLTSGAEQGRSHELATVGWAAGAGVDALTGPLGPPPLMKKRGDDEAVPAPA